MADPLPVRQTVDQARQALRQGDVRLARRLAQRAAAADPKNDEVWLMMAAVASPRASLIYLKRALEINPTSRRARRAMAWAVQRARRAAPPRRFVPTIRRRPIVAGSIPSSAWTARQPPIPLTGLVWGLIVLLVGVILLLGIGTTMQAQAALAGVDPLRVAQILWVNPTLTPSITPTATTTPTPTATFTPTFTPTFTFTPTPTETPLPTATFTPLPTEPPPPGPDNPPLPILPEGVGESDPWIDVNLTWQRAYAYRGATLINSFIVSTGTAAHPTVTGTFQIYLRYRYADMSGPGYYLPDVPYVMYFYEGYGLHGTYWHENFGTPMSHGCVNFRTEDAGWVFDFTDFGTIVNVHY